MKRRDELKPGDIIYRCDYDMSEDEAIPFDEVIATVEKFVVVHHNHANRDGHHLYAVQIDENSWMRASEWEGGSPSPVAMLHCIYDEEYETPIEAIRAEAAWRAHYGQAHVRDAAILRDWADANDGATT